MYLNALVIVEERHGGDVNLLVSFSCVRFVNFYLSFNPNPKTLGISTRESNPLAVVDRTVRTKYKRKTLLNPSIRFYPFFFWRSPHFFFAADVVVTFIRSFLALVVDSLGHTGR